jgi:hypothetical protein
VPPCAYLVVQAGFSDHGDEDVIGLSDNLDPLRSDLADDPDTNTRTRERVPHDEILMDTKLASKSPHFILESAVVVSAQAMNSDTPVAW